VAEPVVAPAALDGVRVDRAVCIISGLSRRSASELVDAGGVTIGGATVTERNRKVREGDLVAFDLGVLDGSADHQASRPGGSVSVEFAVVHADEHLIVVDKPAGLVVHHGAGHHAGTLADGLLQRFPDLADLISVGADPQRPGIVHRLDKGTSGLMVVARSAEALRSLSDQLKSRRAGRQYLALVAGELLHDEGIVDAPIGRSGRVATRMAVTPRGRSARTAYRVIERIAGPPEATLIEATLETGRTHQVRVHMAAIGHPVGGDDRYGEQARTSEMMAGAVPRPAPDRLFLHAHRLTIDHPTGGPVSWTSPLPEDLEAVLDARRPTG
jgi:23S rRNA pseudouridine1911/1915/1917 synthase